MTHGRPKVAIVSLVLSLVLIAAGCSSDPELSFDLAEGEVGCILEYGDETDREIGPLGPSDSEDIEINSYSRIRIGRTAVSVVIVVHRERDGMTTGADLNTIPEEGVRFEGMFRDAGHPAYIITCWKGADGQSARVD